MVSILVPVYNAEPYLRECLTSLTGQTYTDLQIVLINDGSTDRSQDIMQELALQDRRIEIYNQLNSGVAATRHRLLDKVRGDFVMFVDSDDWIEPETIEFLLREQAVDDYDLVKYDLTGHVHETATYNREQVVKKFLEHGTFRGSLCDKLIKAHLYKGLDIDQTVSYGEDAMMVWQILQRVDKVRVIDKAFYHYRVNEKSLSRQRFNGRKFTAYTAWDMICRETSEFWPQYSDIARARFACEMTQILRSAAINGYKHDNNIRLLQEEVRRDCKMIRKTGVSSTKMWLYALLISRNYWLAGNLSRSLNK